MHWPVRFVSAVEGRVFRFSGSIYNYCDFFALLFFRTVAHCLDLGIQKFVIKIIRDEVETAYPAPAHLPAVGTGHGGTSQDLG